MNTHTDNTKADLRGVINVHQSALNALRRKCKRLEAENERLRRQIRQPRDTEAPLPFSEATA